MKNKGFTLIELLAVIVILAIIALIATPIILNIIEDARNSSKERSVEMYARAVQNGIAAYKLKFPTDDNIKLYKLYKSYNGVRDFIEYDGEEIDCDVHIYSTGNVYVTNCTVGGEKVLTENSTEENEEFVSFGEESMEAHIGETVNYVATGTSYTGQWRILGVENAQVLLISDSIGTLTLLGKDGGDYTRIMANDSEKIIQLSNPEHTDYGYNNAITQLDAMTSGYAGGTKAISSRSVRAADVNKVTGYNPYKIGTGETFRDGQASEYGNVVTYSYNAEDGKIYYKGANGVEGTRTDKVVNNYDDFNGINISSSNPNNTLSHTSTYYYYSIETLTGTRHPSEPSIGLVKDTDEFNMIYATNICSTLKYWLADQDISAAESRTSWQIRDVWGETVTAMTLYHSFDDDDEVAKIADVRAVVTLAPDAVLTKDASGVWQIS